MQIIHVVTSLNRGGAETQLLTLTKLQAHRNRVTVFGLRDKGTLSASFIEAGVRVVESRRASNLLSLLKLRQLLKSNDFEIVHAHLPRAELISRLALVGLNIPLVVTRHNHEPFIPSIRRRFSFFSRLLSIWITSRASCVIAISDSVGKFLIKNGEVSKKTKTQRIYYGYESTIVPSHERKESSNGRFVVGTISRLVSQKRLDVLLKAFAILNGATKNYQLNIVGSGEQEKFLKKLAFTLQIEGSTSWFPNTPDRLDLLIDFDVFVLTSEYEGFGLVLLEAIQLGVPVLASNNTAIREVLGEDYVGLFPTGNFELLAQRIEMFQNFSRIEKNDIMMYLKGRLEIFSPKRMFDEVMQCYEVCRKA